MRDFLFVLLFLLAASCTHKSLPPADLVPSVSTSPPNKNSLQTYEKWFSKEKPASENFENQFVIHYLKFLKNGNKKEANRSIEILKTQSLRHQAQLAIDEIGIFSGYYKSTHANENLATLSIKNLKPMMESGDDSALTFFLIYTAAVKMKDSDIEMFNEYSQLIKSKHSAKISQITQKHARYFRQFPPAIF